MERINVLGIGARAITAGLEVMSVQPNTFAANLGLTAGDLLVEIAGAPNSVPERR